MARFESPRRGHCVIGSLPTYLKIMTLSDQDDEPGADDDSESRNDEQKNDQSSEGKDDDDSRDHFADRADGGRVADPINSGAGDQSKTDTGESQVEVNREHPFGDYSKALFDVSKEIVDRLASESSKFNDLKEIFDEAQRSRDFYASWAKQTSTEPRLNSDQANRSSGASLIENYEKVEMLGEFLGMTSTSTTGGSHKPGSAHYLNGAVDFNVAGVSAARLEIVMWEMRNAGLYVRDERGQPLQANGTPQNPWSNPHIHAQAIPTDPRKNGPLDRWSEPHWAPGTYMVFTHHDQVPVNPARREPR